MNIDTKKLVIGVAAVATVIGVALYATHEHHKACYNSLEAKLARKLADEVDTYRHSERHLRLVKELRADLELPLADMMRKIELDIAFNVLPNIEVMVESHRTELSAKEFDQLVTSLNRMVMRIIPT